MMVNSALIKDIKAELGINYFNKGEPMYSIGIDIGTTNCKLCLFDLSTLELIDVKSFKTPKITTQYGEDFDLNYLYQQIQLHLIELIESFDKPEEIRNLVIASVGESGVLVDETGEIVGPAITWYDTRTKNKVADIQQKLSREKIYSITGLPAHSNYSLTKVLWIQDTYDIELDNLKWLCLAEYIAYQLTGIKKSEYSLASRTMMLNISTQTWATEIRDTFSLGELFNDIVPSGKNISTIKNILPSKFDNLNIEVSIGGHDHMCGSIAVDLQKGQILNSTGTTEGLLILTRQANFSNEFLKNNLSNGIYVIDNMNTVYASLPTAGYAIEWFKKHFSVSDEQLEKILTSLQEKILDTNYIQEQKSSIFIPHLRGSGPPNRNIFAKGLWYGFNENTELEDVLYSIFKGLCFELRNILEQIESLISAHHSIIKVIGAASKNPIWLQLKADILEREIQSYSIKEAVCKGAVILAGLKNGYLTQEVLKKNRSEKTMDYKPSVNASRIYTESFKNIYKQFHQFKSAFEKVQQEK